MSYNIEVQSGSTVRLPTKGKYCDRDIVVTATAGKDEGYGIIKAGTYIPNETYELSINLSIEIPFTCNEVEFNRISVSARDTIMYKGDDSLLVGEAGQFTDRSPITVLEDSDTAGLASYPAEYEWFMQHYTLQTTGGAEDLYEELTTQAGALEELAEEIEHLEDAEPSKLQLILGTQDINNSYTITQVDVGDVDEIPQYFFYQKTGLTEVDIPSVISLGQYAFYSCSNLEKVNFPNVERIGAYCFQHCAKIKYFDFQKATTVGQRAFSNCTALESISIPEVTSIGTYAFNSCTYLVNVVMQKVKTIDSYAFQHCYRIAHMTIPATCTSIGNNAFSNFGRYTDTGKAIYRFLGDKPPTIYANSFNKDYIEKIIVNKGCGETYKAATNWAGFADYIEEAAE